jgi:hypothetical protein
MPAPNSSLAYEDAFGIFDAALADPRGIRIPFPDYESAYAFRFRLNNARVANRRENAEAYNRDHPMHGKSEYDQLTVRIKSLDDQTYIYVERVAEIPAFESLSDLDPPPSEPNSP